MRTVTHREMRNQSGEILRAVAGGETIHVTNRGRIAAVISPATGDSLADLEATGRLRPPRRPLSDLAQITRGTSPTPSEELLRDTRGSW